MQHKIVIAITGASGSIYAKVLLDKLAALNTQIAQVGIVMSKNAKEVWEIPIITTTLLTTTKNLTLTHPLPLDRQVIIP
jgi:4-hydroxy-3-polyprenylbenzoate decarboxylase